MGNCDFKTDKQATQNDNQMGRNMFIMHYIIGRGGFGKVIQVN